MRSRNHIGGWRRTSIGEVQRYRSLMVQLCYLLRAFESGISHLDNSRIMREWAVRELGETATSLSKRLGLTQSGVSKSVARGEKIVRDMNLKLFT
ncbi:MAG: hypothetical protein R6T98_07340 [Desulfatiglandales bacterium]